MDRIVCLNRHVAVFVDELGKRDDTLGLVTHIDDDFRGRHLQHGPFDDFAFGEIAEATLVHRQKALVLSLIDVTTFCVGRRQRDQGGVGLDRCPIQLRRS